MNNRYDAVIIGAGASGMMCAIAAKQNNHSLRIALIEKNDRVGKKLLATGNGRCNLTNCHITPEHYFGSFQRQAGNIFAKYDSSFLLRYFSSLGLLASSDHEGRVYPLSRQASSVLDVMRFSCERLGVEFFCGETVCSVRKQREFIIKSKSGEWISDKLVIACGSKAAPKLGGSASGADILKNFGHTIVPFSPALCPLRVNSDVLKSLKGLRANGRVSLLHRDRAVRSERGEIQFADTALSGICVFNLSLYARQGDRVTVDLFDDISESELFKLLIKNRSLFSSLTIDNIFMGILQKRLAQAVLKILGFRDFSQICGAVSKNELKQIAEKVKKISFEITDTTGFEQAQCARGGVLGEEIDETSMQSKKMRKLYICGETIDLCGECGGYNLHFAFVSGIIAGEHL